MRFPASQPVFNERLNVFTLDVGNGNGHTLIGKEVCKASYGSQARRLCLWREILGPEIPRKRTGVDSQVAFYFNRG